MSNFSKRDAIPRARFFLKLAKQCPAEQIDDFEAYLEASMVFARAALLRFMKKYEKSPKKNPNWKQWWDSLTTNPAVKFFKDERNQILKEGPPKLGQIIGKDTPTATEQRYYENPQTSATDTVEKHLNAIEALIVDAESHFFVP